MSRKPLHARVPWVVGALWAAFALAPWAASGQPYPPELRFRTLETPHFLVHFHDETEALARRAAVLAERAHEQLVPLLGHEPRERTHLVVTDLVDDANGSATALPNNVIRINAATPEPRGVLNQFDDYLWILLVHEYTHVLHLDTVHGLPHLGNLVFGKQFSPNAAWPNWFVEGLAVYEESRLSSAGRLRSSLHEMELRMHLLEGTVLPLHVLSSPPLTWPRRDAWYLYGGRFLQHIARKTGDASLKAISLDNAARVIPWMMHDTARVGTGWTFDFLYRDWLREEWSAAQAKLARAEPLTPETQLTRTGEIRRSPRLSRDGGTLYSILIDARRRPHLTALDLATGAEREVATLHGDGAFTVLPDGRLLVAQSDQHREFRWHDDLFLLDPKRGSLRRLTHGRRLSEPDVAPDGRVVCIRRSGAGRTDVVLFDSLKQLDTSEPRLLHEGLLGEPLASPRFSPDGGAVVFSEHRRGSWDLRLLDLATGELRELTDDSAQDLTPSFSSDGRRVLFTSDRTGIFDVYALDLADGAVTRLTRVAGGAFEPLETGAGVLHYVRYGALGYDLAAQPGVVAAEPAAEAEPRLAGSIPRRLESFEGEAAPYRPLETLRPAYWTPLLGFDGTLRNVGVTTTGFDVLRRWRWAASAWYAFDSERPGFHGRVRTDAVWPALVAEVAHSVTRVGDAGPWDPVVRASTLVGRVFADWTFRRRWSTTTLSPGFELGLPAATWSRDDFALPVRRTGRLVAPFLSVRYSDAQRFVRSISAEEGRIIEAWVRWADPRLGSQIDSRSARFSWTEFLRIPGLDHHVLALRGMGGARRGRDDVLPLVIGNPEFSLWDFLQLQSSTGIPRGYATGSLSGNAYVAGSAEYRFPLGEPELGLSLLPVLLRRLHGAVFVDVGDAFDLPKTPAPRLGLGAELRTELTLGYFLTANLRLGYARGLSEGGVHQLLLAASTDL